MAISKTPDGRMENGLQYRIPSTIHPQRLPPVTQPAAKRCSAGLLQV
jgi:hypothetical protein